jgi:hypothetical protein
VYQFQASESELELVKELESESESELVKELESESELVKELESELELVKESELVKELVKELEVLHSKSLFDQLQELKCLDDRQLVNFLGLRSNTSYYFVNQLPILKLRYS